MADWMEVIDQIEEDIEDGVLEGEPDDLIIVQEVVRDEGSVVVFGGFYSATGKDVRFAVDHRLAQGLVTGLEDDENVLARIEPWQVVG